MVSNYVTSTIEAEIELTEFCTWRSLRCGESVVQAAKRIVATWKPPLCVHPRDQLDFSWLWQKTGENALKIQRLSSFLRFWLVFLLVLGVPSFAAEDA